jgi:hypothetical protein
MAIENETPRIDIIAVKRVRALKLRNRGNVRKRQPAACVKAEPTS